MIDFSRNDIYIYFFETEEVKQVGVCAFWIETIKVASLHGWTGEKRKMLEERKTMHAAWAYIFD